MARMSSSMTPSSQPTTNTNTNTQTPTTTPDTQGGGEGGDTKKSFDAGALLSIPASIAEGFSMLAGQNPDEDKGLTSLIEKFSKIGNSYLEKKKEKEKEALENQAKAEEERANVEAANNEKLAWQDSQNTVNTALNGAPTTPAAPTSPITTADGFGRTAM